MQKIGVLINISGPLLDNKDHFVGTVNETRRHYSHEPKPADEILSLFAYDPDSFKRHMGLDSRHVMETFEDLWERNVRNNKYRIRQTPDGVKLMNTLACPQYEGLGIVLFGREPRRDVDLYKRSGMIPSKYPVLTGDMVNGGGDGEYLEKAREMAGSEYRDTIVVSDSIQKLRKAKELGMRPVGIDWGWRTVHHREFFSEDITVARTYSDIVKEIEFVRNRYRQSI